MGRVFLASFLFLCNAFSLLEKTRQLNMKTIDEGK